MRGPLILCAVAAAILALGASAHAAPSPEGLWRMSSGKASVRISACGASYCATLAGLRKPNDKQGRPKRDRKNPNPALRDRPVVGVTLVSGLTPGPAGWTGRFYNPDDGRTYAGSVSADGPDRLKLRGCVLGLLCKTQTLVRAD